MRNWRRRCTRCGGRAGIVADANAVQVAAEDEEVAHPGEPAGHDVGADVDPVQAVDMPTAGDGPLLGQRGVPADVDHAGADEAGGGDQFGPGPNDITRLHCPMVGVLHVIREKWRFPAGRAITR